MENDEVILLNFWPTIFGMRVKVALAEKEIKYEYKEEDLFTAKIQYINEVWNYKAPLLPYDPYERAQARFWADYTDKLYDYGRKIWATKRDELEEAEKELIDPLKLLELEVLGDKPYFGGESFSFVDIALIGFYCWFYTYENFANFSIEAECPKLAAWDKRCMQRDSVFKSLPDPRKIYEVLLEFRKNYGVQ